MKNAFFAPETENEHFCRDTKCHFDMEECIYTCLKLCIYPFKIKNINEGSLDYIDSIN